MDAGEVRSFLLTDKSITDILKIYNKLMTNDYNPSHRISKDEIAGIIETIQSMDDYFLENNEIDEQKRNIAKIFKQKYLNALHKDMYYEGASSDDDDDDINATLLSQVASKATRNPDSTAIYHQKKSDSTQQAECTSFLGFTNGRSLMRALSRQSLEVGYPLLMLDTRNRIRSDADQNARNNIRWDFYEGVNVRQGTVSGIGFIKDIVSVECGTIYLPNIEDNAFTEFRQISMFIHEFSAQAGIINDKVRFHFLFNAENIATDTGTERLKLIPAFEGAAETKFARPITGLSSLTVSFGSPAERITFGHDHDPAPTSVSTANPAVFTTSFNHGLSNGDLVYLEGFTTGDVNADSALITLANQEKGHIIQNKTANTFEIAALDSSGATGTVTVTRIIFGSQRFFIPLKLTYLAMDDE